MANNRFDSYLPNDYSFQVHTPQEYMPDLNMLDSLLGGLQKEYDTGMSTLNRIMPNYLRNSPTDVEAANAFKTKYDGIIANASEAFASGNISEGRRLMSQGMREIEKDQLPGGDYYELERRVGEYKGIVDKYNKMYKDAPGGYLPHILNKVGITDFRDPQTGEAQSIIDPNYGSYVNIGEELDKRLNGFKSDKGTIVKVGDKWIFEESREQVSEQDIQRAAQRILSEPRFAQQLGLETEMTLPNISQEEVANYQLAAVQSSLPKNPRQLQKFLKQKGYYKGPVDGVTGDLTRSAIDQYLKDNMREPVTAEQLARHRVMDTYITPVVDKYGFTHIDKSVKANPYAVEKEKIDYMNYNPFVGITIPGRTQDTKNHIFETLKDLQTKNQNLQKNIASKLEALAQEAGISDARNLFNLTDDQLQARGISPQKVRQVQYQAQQAEKQFRINEQLKKEAEEYANKKVSTGAGKGYTEAMSSLEQLLPEVMNTVPGYERFGESDISRGEAIAAIKKGKWKPIGIGSTIAVYNDSGQIISRITGKQAESFRQAADKYDKISSDVRKYEKAVDEYVESTQQGLAYQPELFTNVVIRDAEGKINPTYTKNATDFMKQFVQNPTNIARYKYIDKEGNEQYYQFSDFVDDLPVDNAGNVDFKQMNITFSGATTDQNPAFGTPTFELSYINDNAEVKTLHAPVPKEVAQRIIYPGGAKPEDGNLAGNTGWNLKQEGIWLANGLLQEAQYQPAKVYKSDYGTFYLKEHPKTGKPISSDQQFIFMTPDGAELTGSEYRDYITGSYIQERLSK